LRATVQPIAPAAGLAESELQRLDQAKLVPGMPAEAYIRTAERTALSYLAKPLSDRSRARSATGKAGGPDASSFVRLGSIAKNGAFRAMSAWLLTPEVRTRQPRIMSYELTHCECAVIKPMLPNKLPAFPADDRRVHNGVFWILRSGAPWRDLRESYGPRTTCYNRFVRWRLAGHGCGFMSPGPRDRGIMAPTTRRIGERE
jgi:hypothetical protein